MRRLALMLIPLVGLGAGATALARSEAPARDVIALPGGCLRGVRVVVRVQPPSGETLNLHVRTGGREVVHLSGVTSDASVTVRLPRTGGRVDVSGRDADGDPVAAGRDYRRCAPRPPAGPRSPEPPAITGGGEG